MSIPIAELSQRLQNALDQNYNVTDMATVLQVITVLEGIQITKEQLETTRLGKYINHLRRKTTNESLARRSKNLLRKWREMVLPATPTAVTNVPPPSAVIAPIQAQINTINTPISASMLKAPQNASMRAISSQYPHQYSNNSDFSTNATEYSTPKSTEVIKNNAGGSAMLSQSQHNQTKHSALFPSSPYDSGGGGGDDPTKHSNGNKKSNVNSSSISNKNAAISNRGGGSMYAPSNTTDHSEDCQQTNKINAKQKQKLDQPYRLFPTTNDSSKSPISISALPKIPKIKKSTSSSLSVNKSVDRSHSPLINSSESSSPLKWSSAQAQRPFSSVTNDDSSVHLYDVQQNLQNYSSNATTVNGREQIYYGNDAPIVLDTNSNSSSINVGASRDIATLPPENVVSEPKKKHKKHKKDKKNKKQKQSPSASAERMLNVSNATLELPDSLSSNSMSLFATTTSSQKVQPPPIPVAASLNSTAFSNTASAPITTQANVAPQSNAKSNVSWPPSSNLSNASATIPADDLTFSGKFAKTEESAVINIDSSSCSNSPKYGNRARSPLLLPIVSRSSSPSKMNALLAKRNVEEESLSNQNISMLPQSVSASASNYGESLSQELFLNVTSSVVASNAAETQPKKRGRKKGSKGVDSRLASSSNMSQSNQSGSQFGDSISFQSLKNKIDSIRGTTKKVKTTKELLAELQNRKMASTADANSVIGGEIGSSYGSQTSSPVLPNVQIHSQQNQFVPSPSSCSENSQQSHTNSTIDMRSTTATPISISPALSSALHPVDPYGFSSRGVHLDRKRSKKKKLIAPEESSNLENINEENETAVDTEPKRTIDDDINELIAQLPPINKSMMVLWKKAHVHDTIACTCRLVEVSEEELAKESSVSGKENDTKVIEPMAQLLPTIASNANDALTKSQPELSRPKPSIFDVDEPEIEATTELLQSNSDSAMTTSTGINIPMDSSASAPPAKKPTVKSIFDLDYEEDEDPIHTFKLNNINSNINNNNNNNKNNNNSNNNNNISNDKNKSCDDIILNENANEATTTNSSIPINNNSSKSNFATMDIDRSDEESEFTAVPAPPPMSSVHHEASDNKLPQTISIPQPQQPIEAPPMDGVFAKPQDQLDANMLPPPVPFKQYRIEEDENCKAKEFFVTSKQSITLFHIEELHNACIQNVNGNWDDADRELPAPSIKEEKSENVESLQIETEVIPTIAVEQDTLKTEQMDGTAANRCDSDDPMVVDSEDFEMEPRITEASIGLYERVVPLCNHLVMDKLPKNLRDISLDFGPSDEVDADIFIANITSKPATDDTQSIEIEDSGNLPDLENQTVEMVESDSELIEFRTNSRCSSQSKSEIGTNVMDVDQENMEAPIASSYVAEMKCLSPSESEGSMESVREANYENACILDMQDMPMESIMVSTALETANRFTESDNFVHIDNENVNEDLANIIVDENARADADVHELDHLHQVIDSSNSNSSHVVPATDENAVDFDNQLSKSFDVMINASQNVESDGRAEELEPEAKPQEIESGPNESDEHISEENEPRQEKNEDEESVECIETVTAEKSNDNCIAPNDEEENEDDCAGKEQQKDPEEATVESVPKSSGTLKISISTAGLKKLSKPIKYKIRRNSVETNESAYGDNSGVDLDGKALNDGRQSGKKIILKLSRQLTTENDNDYNNCDGDDMSVGYMDDEDSSSDEFDEDDDIDDFDEDADDLDTSNQSYNNCGNDGSYDGNHFITLKNFDTGSESSSRDESPRKGTSVLDNEENLFGIDIGEVEEEEEENDDDLMNDCEIDDDSDTINNVMMFCKPVIEDGKSSSSNIFNNNENSDEGNNPFDMMNINEANDSNIGGGLIYSAEKGDKLATESLKFGSDDVDVDVKSNDKSVSDRQQLQAERSERDECIETTATNSKEQQLNSHNSHLTDKTTSDLSTFSHNENQNISNNEYYNNHNHPLTEESLNLLEQQHRREQQLSQPQKEQKRHRSSSTSSMSSTSSTSMSSSTSDSDSPRSKKMKRWRRRPCPQHYRCASDTSQTSSISSTSINDAGAFHGHATTAETEKSPANIENGEKCVDTPNKESDPCTTFCLNANATPSISAPVVESPLGSLNIRIATDKSASSPLRLHIVNLAGSRPSVAKDPVITTSTVIDGMTNDLDNPPFSPLDSLQAPKIAIQTVVNDILPTSETPSKFLHEPQEPISIVEALNDSIPPVAVGLPEQLFENDDEKEPPEIDDCFPNQSIVGTAQPPQETQHDEQQTEMEESQTSSDHHCDKQQSLSAENNGLLPSFNNLTVANATGVAENGYKFKEWYEVVHVKSYNDELLTILPYVVID